jgi:hypothetical protein
MSAWTVDELDRIGSAEEVRLAPRRSDGTPGRSVVVWVVRHGDELYIRSVNGRGSSWFRGVQDRHEAIVRAGGVEKDVNLIESNDIDDQVDDAYRTKYGSRYPSIVPSILNAGARAATLRLQPH